MGIRLDVADRGCRGAFSGDISSSAALLRTEGGDRTNMVPSPVGGTFSRSSLSSKMGILVPKCSKAIGSTAERLNTRRLRAVCWSLTETSSADTNIEVSQKSPDNAVVFATHRSDASRAQCCCSCSSLLPCLAALNIGDPKVLAALTTENWRGDAAFES